jgi:hypothetical protein
MGAGFLASPMRHHFEGEFASDTFAKLKIQQFT